MIYKFNTILVQLEEEVTERTLALKKTYQKMKKKNQQLVESRHKYKDRLRQHRQQQQLALQQTREAIESLNGQLQVERRSKQELEENLDQKRQQKLSIDLFIQAQRSECKVCLVEEMQVLFLPCRQWLPVGSVQTVSISVSCEGKTMVFWA